MVERISTLGMQLINANNLMAGQYYMSVLTQQLATGKKSLSLTDYTSSQAQQLMNFSNSITENESFIAVAKSVSPRITVYDDSLTNIEDIAAKGSSLTTSQASYNPEQNGSTAAQIQGFMKQISYYLNQKVGERFIFSGTRYGTAPVADITALPVPPTETAPYVTATNTLPSYDSDYTAWDPLVDPPPDPNINHPEAYAKDQVAIDTTQMLQYGITSTQTGFQQVIIGLRFAYAATQDQTNYTTLMNTARQLITDGLMAIRGYHSALSSANTTLEQAKETHENMINTLQGQIDDIQNVDVNEVAVRINSYQSELQASYAATAQMTSLSILKFL